MYIGVHKLGVVAFDLKTKATEGNVIKHHDAIHGIYIPGSMILFGDSDILSSIVEQNHLLILIKIKKENILTVGVLSMEVRMYLMTVNSC